MFSMEVVIATDVTQICELLQADYAVFYNGNFVKYLMTNGTHTSYRVIYIDGTDEIINLKEV